MKKMYNEGSFSQRVWELALCIPEGRVTTYGTIAKAAGAGPMHRGVFQASYQKRQIRKRFLGTVLCMQEEKYG